MLPSAKLSWAKRLIALAVMGAIYFGTMSAYPASWPKAGKFDTRVVVFDQLTQASVPLRLRGKLEHIGVCGILRNMEGYPVYFQIPSIPWAPPKPLITDNDGAAWMTVVFPSPVPHPYLVHVRFPGSPHHHPTEGMGQVFVWPADSQILVTDIDRTISDLGEWKVPFTANQDIPPLSDSVAVLQSLSQRYRIVYLTARAELFYAKTRAWLDEKGFPEGPLFCQDYRQGMNAQIFKQCFIKDLKKRFPHVMLGIGDRSSDAAAYIGNDLQTFIIDPSGKKSFPKQAIVIPSWRVLWQQLTAHEVQP